MDRLPYEICLDLLKSCATISAETLTTFSSINSNMRNIYIANESALTASFLTLEELKKERNQFYKIVLFLSNPELDYFNDPTVFGPSGSWEGLEGVPPAALEKINLVTNPRNLSRDKLKSALIFSRRAKLISNYLHAYFQTHNLKSRWKYLSTCLGGAITYIYRSSISNICDYRYFEEITYSEFVEIEKAEIPIIRYFLMDWPLPEPRDILPRPGGLLDVVIDDWKSIARVFHRLVVKRLKEVFDEAKDAGVLGEGIPREEFRKAVGNIEEWEIFREKMAAYHCKRKRGFEKTYYSLFKECPDPQLHLQAGRKLAKECFRGVLIGTH